MSSVYIRVSLLEYRSALKCAFSEHLMMNCLNTVVTVEVITHNLYGIRNMLQGSNPLVY